MSKLDDFLKENKNGLSNNTNSLVDIDTSTILDKDSQIAKDLKVKDILTDINLKKVYGYCILGILSFWLLIVAFICITYIFQEKPNMSDAVLITLLTTTTANILILPTIVVKYLFPK